MINVCLPLARELIKHIRHGQLTTQTKHPHTSHKRTHIHYFNQGVPQHHHGLLLPMASKTFPVFPSRLGRIISTRGTNPYNDLSHLVSVIYICLSHCITNTRTDHLPINNAEQSEIVDGDRLINYATILARASAVQSATMSSFPFWFRFNWAINLLTKQRLSK